MHTHALILLKSVFKRIFILLALYQLYYKAHYKIQMSLFIITVLPNFEGYIEFQ